jgi:hypothetical protein
MRPAIRPAASPAPQVDIRAGGTDNLGNISRGSASASDSIDVSGGVNGGQFIVDGTADLGSDSITAHNGFSPMFPVNGSLRMAARPVYASNGFALVVSGFRSSRK